MLIFQILINKRKYTNRIFAGSRSVNEMYDNKQGQKLSIRTKVKFVMKLEGPKQKSN